MKKFIEVFHGKVEGLAELKSLLTGNDFRFTWTNRINENTNFNIFKPSETIIIAERSTEPNTVVLLSTKYTAKGTIRRGSTNIYTKAEALGMTKLQVRLNITATASFKIEMRYLNSQIDFFLSSIFSNTKPYVPVNSYFANKDVKNELLHGPLFYLGEYETIASYSKDNHSIGIWNKNLNYIKNQYKQYNLYVDSDFPNQLTRAMYTLYKMGDIRGNDFIKAHQILGVPINQEDMPEEIMFDLMY